MEIIQQLEKDVDRLTDLMNYYKSMHEQSKDKPLFVYLVNDVYAMEYKNGVTDLSTYSMASVLTENVANQIAEQANFKNSKGQKITPIGIQPAHEFFLNQSIDVLETLGMFEKKILALKGEL